MIAKIALPVATFAIVLHLFMIGYATHGPRACTMHGENGRAAPFSLTVSPQTMSVDFGQGDQFVFPINREMSDAKFTVAAKREAHGSVSILLDNVTGEFQETILTPGNAPDFLNGQCPPR